MDDITNTDERIAVWKSMAEHFLDTETRHEIPYTALLCVGAGMSIEEARAVWDHEVSPVLYFNLLGVAGEWGAWDDEWLIPKLTARTLRRRSAWRRGLANLLLPFRFELNTGVWRAVERCMRVLEDTSPDRRDVLVQDLSLLARYYFDMTLFCRDQQLDDARRERLRGLVSVLFNVLEPATLSDERSASCLRVARLLAGNEEA